MGVVVIVYVLVVERDCIRSVIIANYNAYHFLILIDVSFHCSICSVVELSNGEDLKPCYSVGFVTVEQF